jgi:hypothetical protein
MSLSSPQFNFPYLFNVKPFLLSLTIIAGLTLLSLNGNAQVTFQKTIGAEEADIAYDIIQSSDGNLVVAGMFHHPFNTFPLNPAYMGVVKLTLDGDTLWELSLGDDFSPYIAHSVKETPDNGYIICGSDPSDGYLIKTNANGHVMWTKRYYNIGGTNDEFSEVFVTPDNGFIISGNTFQGGENSLLVKTDANGNVEWSKKYSIGNSNLGHFVRPTFDGGYIVLSSEYTLAPNYDDIYLFKVNSTGIVQWAKKYGGGNYDRVTSCVQTADSGFVLLGQTGMFNPREFDILMLRTDATGNLLWAKTYDSSSEDFGYDIQKADNGFIVTGTVGDQAAYPTNCFLMKTDFNGDTLWTVAYGDTMYETPYSVVSTSDLGYVVAGTTSSFGADEADMYLVKTDSEGNSICSPQNVSTIIQTINFPQSTLLLNSSGGTIFQENDSILFSHTVYVNTICTNVGIPELELQNINLSVVPNPFNGSTVISFDHLQGHDYTCRIYSSTGKLLRTMTNIRNGNFTFHKEGLSQGLYFAVLFDEEQIVGNTKIVIE